MGKLTISMAIFNSYFDITSPHGPNGFGLGWFRKKSTVQLIGLREKLQENPIFHGKTYGFL